jgi:hypothetical protein
MVPPADVASVYLYRPPPGPFETNWAISLNDATYIQVENEINIDDEYKVYISINYV